MVEKYSAKVILRRKLQLVWLLGRGQIYVEKAFAVFGEVQQ